MTNLELGQQIKQEESNWNENTKKIIHKLWSRMEQAETNFAVMNARVAKKCPLDLYLYTKEEYETYGREEYDRAVHNCNPEGYEH